MEILLVVATLLGGLAALWYFWDKLKDFFKGHPVEELAAVREGNEHERDFKRHRRERAFAEIEDLKDAIGRLYELTANWKGYDAKVGEYANGPSFCEWLRIVEKWRKLVCVLRLQ